MLSYQMSKRTPTPQPPNFDAPYTAKFVPYLKWFRFLSNDL